MKTEIKVKITQWDGKLFGQHNVVEYIPIELDKSFDKLNVNEVGRQVLATIKKLKGELK